MVSEIRGPGAGAPSQIGQNSGKNRSAEPAAPAGSGETVSVTNLATRLAELSEAAKDLSPVDQARVQEIRDAIAAGEYKIEEREIAEKLTALEAQLGRRS